MPRPIRAALAALTLIIAVAATVVLPAGAASAAAYRYWGFYQLDGDAWAFATKGADQTTPADGAVDGWRYALTGEGDTRMPRDVVTFDEVCGKTAAEDGKKRVAVVIDFGRTSDAVDGNAEVPAPVAECASVPTAATSAEVLAAVAETVRVEKSLVCGIDGYPASGCAEEVKSVGEAAAAPDDSITIAPAADSAAGDGEASDSAAGSAADSASDDGGPGAGTLVAIVVIIAAALGAAAVALRRRGQH